MEQEIIQWPKNMPPAGFLNGLSNPDTIKNKMTTIVVIGFLVGVSGFEPEASWTRTKRDTKLRHTPIARNIIMNFHKIVKSRNTFSLWSFQYAD